MQTHQLHVSGAHEGIQQIRSELFAFPEVLDVFATGRPDALVVVYAGRPRPGEWLRALRAIGYRTLARDRAKWPQTEQRRPDLLRWIVDYSDVGADDNETLSSIGNEQAQRRRRNAA